MRAPEVAAARTLLDKLTAWCGVNGIVPPEELARALAPLEHGDPEQVVADFRARLDRPVHRRSRTSRGGFRRMRLGESIILVDLRGCWTVHLIIATDRFDGPHFSSGQV